MFPGNFCVSYVPVFVALELSTYFIELSILSHKSTYILTVYAKEVVDALLRNGLVHARSNKMSMVKVQNSRSTQSPVESRSILV
jgi:hypothetical protein